MCSTNEPVIISGSVGRKASNITGELEEVHQEPYGTKTLKKPDANVSVEDEWT